ncbi:MAG: macro domain-containing protein [Thermaerobacter sp.]|jgi:O-acetyl-ADP-ribose deacetylase (regulator of RNase III)|nr:macro domain-containing protein [Thermaerobacter sp.]
MLRVRVVQGDIAEQAVDAVVNAANNALWMGAGVAGALRRRGGAGIEAEAMRQGPIPVGEAVVTGGGALPARHVIHAAVMGQDLTTDADKIRRATVHSLTRAEELGAQSVAFPALGTGVGGFPLEEATRIIVQQARRRWGDTDREVVLVAWDAAARRAFEAALADV